MNIQIFGTKKCNDTKKAERFFKERGIKYQFIDMKEKGMSKGEFNSVAQVNGGAFGAVMLFSLFWKRCNLAGALSGMVAGGVVVFVWKYFVRPLGGAFDIYELLPAFLVSCVVIVIVSLLTKAPDEAVIKEFDAANIK